MHLPALYAYALCMRLPQGVHYLFDPTGWGVQLDVSMAHARTMPGCEDPYQVCANAKDYDFILTSVKSQLLRLKNITENGSQILLVMKVYNE
jgi:hypothetical protein